MASASPAATHSRARSTDAARSTAASASASSASARSACGSSARPAAVSSTRRDPRTNSGAPTRFSSDRTSWLAVGCEMSRRSAARVKLASAATSTKARSWAVGYIAIWQ